MGDTYFPTMILRDITQFDRLFQARKLLLNLQIPHIITLHIGSLELWSLKGRYGTTAAYQVSE